MASRRPDPGSAQTIDDDAATLVAVSAERFEESVRPLLRQAFHLAQSMLLDRHEAEDAVQDATLNAWRSFGQFRDHGGGLRPWFLKIVANQCRSRLRSRWWQVWRRAELRDGGGAAAAVALLPRMASCFVPTLPAQLGAMRGEGTFEANQPGMYQLRFGTNGPQFALQVPPT
jgi:RNA polymerase sigma factor (sigma-70 family)